MADLEWKNFDWLSLSGDYLKGLKQARILYIRMEENVICSRCNEPNPRETHMKGNRLLKMCEYCRKLKTTYRKLNPQPGPNRSVKCPHNKRRCVCVECDGTSICEHKKIKWNCHLCKPKDINHNV